MDFFDAEDQEVGSLRARFQLKEDYSQWDFRVGELSGFILQRWNGRANEWEIRSGNTFITVTATWPGQFDSWRITAKDTVYYLTRDRDPQDFNWELSYDQKRFVGYTIFIFAIPVIGKSKNLLKYLIQQ